MLRFIWAVFANLKRWLLSLWLSYQQAQDRARLEALQQDMLSRLQAAESEAKRLRARLGMELLHEEELKVLREEERIRTAQADGLRAELARLGVDMGV